MTLLQQVKVYMVLNKVSQHSVADTIGCHVVLLRKVLNGQYSLSKAMKQKLEAFLEQQN